MFGTIRVACPATEGLVQVSADRSTRVRRCGARAQRLGRAVVDAGYEPGAGTLVVAGPPDIGPHIDLAIALCLVLSDPRCDDLRRSGWIAWGTMRADGAVAPATGELTNGLDGAPSVGQIWHPDAELPAPEVDATVALTRVRDLPEAVAALRFFAAMEDRLADLGELGPPASTATLPGRPPTSVERFVFRTTARHHV